MEDVDDALQRLEVGTNREGEAGLGKTIEELRLEIGG